MAPGDYFGVGESEEDYINGGIDKMLRDKSSLELSVQLDNVHKENQLELDVDEAIRTIEYVNYIKATLKGLYENENKNN